MKKKIKNLIFIIAITVVMVSSVCYAKDEMQGFAGESTKFASTAVNAEFPALQFYSTLLGSDDTEKIKKLIIEYDKGNKLVYDGVIEIVEKHSPGHGKYIAEYIVKNRTFSPTALCQIKNGEIVGIENVAYSTIPITNPEILEIWEMIKKYSTNYMIQHIVLFNVDIGRPKNRMMSITPVDDICEYWQLNVEKELINDKKEFKKQLAKMLGIYTFSNCNYITIKDNSTKNNYSNFDNVYATESPINQYYIKFWKGHQAEVGDEFQMSNYTSYVGASNCLDDFGEVFAYATINGIYKDWGNLMKKTRFFILENSEASDYLHEIRNIMSRE